MTKHTEKPAPAQATTKTPQNDALSEADLAKISGGGKAQSDVSAKASQTTDGIAQNMKG